jgi:flagellar basal-body rod modification protein FlgD
MSTDINSINQAITASQATTASSGTSTTKKTDVSMGKEDFLKLLVAQLQHQDPLTPDNPTEFTAQLAQFSSLEQLTTLNASMDKLITSNTNSGNLATLNTIGKDVAYTGNSFNFTGSSMELGYKLDAQASAVTLSLQQNGATVATLKGTDLSTGNHFIAWNGLTDDGAKAPSGSYNIVIKAIAADGKTAVTASPLIKSEVTGVDLSGQSGGTLITKAGETAYTSVVGVYDPGTSTGSTTTASALNTAAAVAKAVLK